MEVNTGEIRETGSKLYPDVAKEFNRISGLVAKADAKFNQNRSDLEDAMNGLLNFIADTLDVSATYLEDCGETLVIMADEYDFVDGENAYNIERPSVGIEDSDHNFAKL